MSSIGYGTRVSHLATRHPDRVALVCGNAEVSWSELESGANRRARLFSERGVERGDIVSIALPNGVDAITHAVACWKIGAIPNPISHRLPAPEREAVLQRAQPKLVIDLDDAPPSPWPKLSPTEAAPPDDSPLPDVVSPHERALASGGSTGVPKLILVKRPATYDSDAPAAVLAPAGPVLVPGPLYHAAPFGSFTQALIGGATTVLMERFDASVCLELIERHRVAQVLFVPTMMHRIWRLPEEERRGRDVSSLQVVFSGGAPCPPWLMRAWIEWLGADVMHELYGPSERIGGTHITGREWLEHPGSVGKPMSGAEIRILDPETLQDLPVGQIGEVFMMPPEGAGSTYSYVGATGRRTDDGWESVGDMGRVDAEGYLYLADRRSDMILCGGRNIYPAQVEAAIDSFAGVSSSAVIGLPDDDLGNRIHAVVQAEAVDQAALRKHLEERIASYSIPHSFEVVDFPLRDDAGKVRRYQLRRQRMSPSSGGGRD